MAQQTINVGTSANDGTGDPLRTSFTKANDNFSDLDGRVTTLEEAPGGTGESVAGYDGATPYLLRGAVSARLYPGVTVGTGMSQAARQSNATALQAAINYAATNKKFFEIEPGEYQIENTAGLVVNNGANGFSWRGTNQSLIRQFGLGPVLVVGDAANSSNIAHGHVIDGAKLLLGIEPATNDTATVGLLTGTLRSSRLANMIAGATQSGATGPIQRPYRACTLGNFSNSVMENMEFDGGRHRIFSASGGTSSAFQAITLRSGTSTSGAISVTESALVFSGFSSTRVAGLTLDYVKLTANNSRAIFTDSDRAVVFEGVYINNLAFGNTSHSIWNFSLSQISVLGLDINNLRALTAEGAVTGNIISNYSRSRISIESMTVRWDASIRIDVDLRLVGRDINTLNNGSTIEIGGYISYDTSNTKQNVRVFPDPHANISDSADKMKWPIQVGKIVVGRALSRLEEPVLRLEETGWNTGEVITWPGIYRNGQIIVPANILENKTIVLSHVQRVANVGSSMPVQEGATVYINRVSGGDAFTLTVRSGTAAGTTVFTGAASAAIDQAFMFNGVQWVTVT